MKNRQFIHFTEARRHSQAHLIQEKQQPTGKLHPDLRHWNYLKISGFDR